MSVKAPKTIEAIIETGTPMIETAAPAMGLVAQSVSLLCDGSRKNPFLTNDMQAALIDTYFNLVIVLKFYYRLKTSFFHKNFVKII